MSLYTNLHVNPSFNYKSFLVFFLFRKVRLKETQYYNSAALSHFNILLCLITLNESVLKIITIKHKFKTKADGNSKQSSTKKETQKTNYKKPLFCCSECSPANCVLQITKRNTLSCETGSDVTASTVTKFFSDISYCLWVTMTEIFSKVLVEKISYYSVACFYN